MARHEHAGQRRRAARARRRSPVARSRRKRIRRKARQHQSRRQGGQGRPAFRLCRSGRRRRPQGPGRLRLGQGARGAGGDPQGDRAGAAQHDPRAAARRPHLHHDIAGRYGAGQGDRARAPRPAPGSSPAARCARSSRRSACRTSSPSRSAASNPHNMIKATFAALGQVDQPARRRGAPRQEGRRDPRPPRRRSAAGARA